MRVLQELELLILSLPSRKLRQEVSPPHRRELSGQLPMRKNGKRRSVEAVTFGQLISQSHSGIRLVSQSKADLGTS